MTEKFVVGRQAFNNLSDIIQHKKVAFSITNSVCYANMLLIHMLVMIFMWMGFLPLLSLIIHILLHFYKVFCDVLCMF